MTLESVVKVLVYGSLVMAFIGIAVATLDHFLYDGAIGYIAKSLFLGCFVTFGLGFILYTRLH